MKVKITKSCSGYDFTFKQGDTVDITDYIARDLVSAGFAEAIAEPKAEPKPKPSAPKRKTKGGDAHANA